MHSEPQPWEDRSVAFRVPITRGMTFRDNGKENGNPRSLQRGLWGYIEVIKGLYRDNGKENGNYRDHIGIVWGLDRGYIGIMEKTMETTKRTSRNFLRGEAAILEG